MTRFRVNVAFELEALTRAEAERAVRSRCRGSLTPCPPSLDWEVGTAVPVPTVEGLEAFIAAARASVDPEPSRLVRLAHRCRRRP